MLIFQHNVQRTLAAAPHAVLSFPGDPARHAELAGSGEVKAVRLPSDSRVGVGSSVEADEEIRVGRKTQKFTAVSMITTRPEPESANASKSISEPY